MVIEAFLKFIVTLISFHLVDYNVTKKSFNFSKKYHLPFYFVSASDGTNVVKVCYDGLIF